MNLEEFLHENLIRKGFRTIEPRPRWRTRMLRLPGVRHVRYLYHKWQMIKHYAFWRELGYLPNNIEHDLAELNRIWRGER